MEVPVDLEPATNTNGFVAGAIDLVYRDPENADLVIPAFKTDRVEGEESLAARAAVYAPQEEVYVAAVRSALDLPATPRAELWFLWSDRLWRAS